MRNKFFENTTVSNLIKNILKNVDIPLYNTITIGDYIIAGCTYIYKDMIINCTSSGNFNVDAEYKVVKDDYIFGRHYSKLTSSFNSNSAVYDTTTHETLGNYLRCFRDVLDVDLMPFYNCVSGRYSSRFYIEEETLSDNETKTIPIVKELPYDSYLMGGEDFNSQYYKKGTLKTLLVPIKFNKKYTIALDCNSSFKIVPIFMNNDRLVRVPIGNLTLDFTNQFLKQYETSYKFISSSFKKPFVLTVTNNNTTLLKDVFKGELVLKPEWETCTFERFMQQYENYLYLMIEYAQDNNSSVVVLEGDYQKSGSLQYFNVEPEIYQTLFDPETGKEIHNVVAVNNMSSQLLDSLCVGKLSLLSISDDVRYPYSDRLIEYLLWSVVDINEDIGYNVKRIQDALSVNKLQHMYGGFDTYLRAVLYHYYKSQKKLTGLDHNGYFDKEIERLMFY